MGLINTIIKTIDIIKTINPNKTINTNKTINPNKTINTNKTINPNKTINTNKTFNTNKTINPNNPNKTNILSYFIKDIKDPIELAFYKQIKINNEVYIFYKKNLLYELDDFNSATEIIWNYKQNIMKFYTGGIRNYKIYSCKYNKYKLLYYKKDNIIKEYKYNDYIYYDYIYNKYLLKIKIEYRINETFLFENRIKYYNRFKFVYIYPVHSKYKGVQICIINKYELHYNTRFFIIN
jgi:hypothetical protein